MRLRAASARVSRSVVVKVLLLLSAADGQGWRWFVLVPVLVVGVVAA